MSSEVNAVPDTELGLTSEEVRLLRFHQTQVDSPSSPAASVASSQGCLLLNGASLAALSTHLDRLMQQINHRLDYLAEQSSSVTLQQYDRAGVLIDNADAEIARFNDIMAQTDELELDFDRIRNIRDIVRGYRHRVEEMERELDHPSSSRRHAHGHHRSSGHGHAHSHRHGGSSSGRHHHRQRH